MGYHAIVLTYECSTSKSYIEIAFSAGLNDLLVWQDDKENNEQTSSYAKFLVKKKLVVAFSTQGAISLYMPHPQILSQKLKKC